jgi:hypothetical protein
MTKENAEYNAQIEQPVEFANNDTPEALLNDPCTPFWAADVIRVALTKDAVDAANVFAVLARSFDARAKAAR